MQYLKFLSVTKINSKIGIYVSILNFLVTFYLKKMYN